MRFTGLAGVGISALGAVLVCTSTRATSAPALDSVEFLQTYAQFTSDDVERLARGETAARALDTDAAEVAICAAIDVAVPPAFYVARFRDIEAFKTGEPVLQVHRFGSPPAPAQTLPEKRPPYTKKSTHPKKIRPPPSAPPPARAAPP